MIGLILDVGHVGKPKPNDRDRGAVYGPRVEAVLAAAYVQAAVRHATAAGMAARVIAPPATGWTYATRHAEAGKIARGNPNTRWLYVQAHLNSAEHDARYGLVGHDPRSRAGKAAAEALAGALLERLRGAAIDSARAEAAEGPWARMESTIAGIYAGPSNLSGCCFEPAFIQSDFWARPDACDLVGRALVEGVQGWAP